mmetsp:Transcript_61613/g.74115  ORF Transcript_61613/g.74115 Transcript_61613/m.74115 type:complete len:189 (-) Transcript_61613:420-986(-)
MLWKSFINVFLLSLIASASAFVPIPLHHRTSITTSLAAFGKRSTPSTTKPTYDKQTGRWEPPPNEDDSELYGPVGALLRQGPGPFITRLTKPDDYEQAVLKYQATEGCTRLEAEGNMDSYFNNAADWAFQKNAEKNGAPKIDYTILKAGDAAKTIVWALGVTPFLLRIVFLIASTGSWDVSLSDIVSI